MASAWTAFLIGKMLQGPGHCRSSALANAFGETRLQTVIGWLVGICGNIMEGLSKDCVVVYGFD